LAAARSSGSSRSPASAAGAGSTSSSFKGDAYARDLGGLADNGWEFPILAVYRKDGGPVRLHYLAQMPREAADPGQDPRSPPEMAALWHVLDLTPEGRGTDWYPKLNY